MSSTFNGNETAPFFGFLGTSTTTLVISCMGAAYETAKSGVGVAMMRPELVMKSIVSVVMAGVLGIYNLIIAVIIGTRVNPRAKSYCLFDGYAHLSYGLAYDLAGVSTSMAIGIVGDAGVRKIEKELKAKMPSLDKKYAMEPEEVGHELLLYSRLSSSPVEIPENVLLEPSKKGRCWNELKSRGMLKWGKRKKIQFLRNDETQKLLKKQ